MNTVSIRWPDTKASLAESSRADLNGLTLPIVMPVAVAVSGLPGTAVITAHPTPSFTAPRTCPPEPKEHHSRQYACRQESLSCVPDRIPISIALSLSTQFGRVSGAVVDRTIGENIVVALLIEASYFLGVEFVAGQLP